MSLRRVVWVRFVVGSLLVPKKNAAPDARWKADLAELALEIRSEGDVAQLDVIDGPGVAMECPAAEKNVAWFKYALRTWPNAQYVGKTEDDTFVHLDMLELELRRLTSMNVPNIIYGLFGICSMPTPARAERGGPQI